MDGQTCSAMQEVRVGYFECFGVMEYEAETTITATISWLHITGMGFDF